jgi:hypothetical protein
VSRGQLIEFVDRSSCCFFQVVPLLYSRGWVDSVPDPLLLRKCGSAGNRTRDLWICNQEPWPLDHRDSLTVLIIVCISRTPITVAAQSKAWTVFARTNTGTVGSNPIRNVDLCMCVYCVFVFTCLGSGFCEWLIPRPRFEKCSSLTKGCIVIIIAPELPTL